MTTPNDLVTSPHFAPLPPDHGRAHLLPEIDRTPVPPDLERMHLLPEIDRTPPSSGADRGHLLPELDFSTSPTETERTPLSADFLHRMRSAFMQNQTLHLWHPERAALKASREAMLQIAHAQGLSTHCLLKGQWSPLLHMLKRVMAANQGGEPVFEAHENGVWLLDEAETMGAEDLALIERAARQISKWPMRLVLLSRATQAPAAPTLATPLVVDWLAAEPPTWMHQEASACAHGHTPSPSPNPGLSTRPRLGTAWAASGATLLVLAAGAAWWGGQTASVTSPQVAAERVAGLEPQVGTNVPKTFAPPPKALAPQATASVAQAKAPAPKDIESRAPETKAPETVAAEVPARVVKAEPAAVTPPAPTSTPAHAAAHPAKPGQPSSLQQWLHGLPEGSFVVLHGQFASAREAEAFKASDPLLVNARISFAVWAAGQPARYGVLNGPFRTADRVSNYMLRLPWRAQARSISREALLKP